MKSLLVACCAASALASSASATMLFDFGRTDTTTGTGWNDIVPATTTLFAIFDSNDNVVPGVSLEITDTFFQAGEPTANIGSTSPSGDAGAYPVSATSDPFFGHNGTFAGQEPNPLGQVTLSGLDPATPYDFTFFGSRQPVGDNRETMYTVSGANSDSGLLAVSNNDTEVVTISGILPTAGGDITVDVQSGPNSNSTFYYINVMEVNAVPEPTSAVLMLVGGLFGLGRRTRG